MVKVLFVCLGNICRSPTAHAVFEYKLVQKNLQNVIEVDSAGTAAYHANNPPDQRSQREAEKRGYTLSHLKARQVTVDDYSYFDYILAMDYANLSQLQQDCPQEHLHKLTLFLKHRRGAEMEVPDPYYGGEDGFQDVLDLVEQASEGLMEEMLEQGLLS